MTEVVVSNEIAVSAAKVWEKLSSFKGIEEFSPIERSVTEGQGEGAKRTCYRSLASIVCEVCFASAFARPSFNRVFSSASSLYIALPQQPKIKEQSIIHLLCSPWAA